MNKAKTELKSTRIDCVVKIDGVSYFLAKDAENNLHLLDKDGKALVAVSINTTRSTSKGSSKKGEASGAIGIVDSTFLWKFLVIPFSLVDPGTEGEFSVMFATKTITRSSRYSSDAGTKIGKSEWNKRGFVTEERIELPSGKFVKVLIDANMDYNGEILPIAVE